MDESYSLIPPTNRKMKTKRDPNIMTMAKFVAALFAAVVVALAGAEVGEEEETATQQKVRSLA